MSFTDPDEAQLAKGVTHGIVLALAVMIGAYNIAAFKRRPSAHLLLNIVSFGGLIILETVNVFRHAHDAGRLKDVGPRPGI